MQGFPEKAKSKLDDYGFIQSRPKGEIHANNQQMSKLLHKAIGLGGKGKAPQVQPSSLVHACHVMSCWHTFMSQPARQQQSIPNSGESMLRLLPSCNPVCALVQLSRV